MVGFGQKEISDLATKNKKHYYISEDEKEKVINEWPLFRRSVKLQATQRTNLFKIYTYLLQECREDMKNILILNIILVISASTAAAKRAQLTFTRSKSTIETLVKDKKYN